MKKLLLLIPVLLLTSCGSKQSDNEGNRNHAKNTIVSKLESDGLGMIKDFEVINLELVDSVNYDATYIFTNPMIGKRIKIQKIFTFSNQGADSIISVKEVSSLFEKDGEWVDMTMKNMLEVLKE
tara:strand:+ start:1039 stop:1410 length:372 start_codon:yes stop_codon:yes gene_type:complete